MTTRRVARWIVPVGAVGVLLGGAAVVNVLPAAAGTPDLPATTPAELIAKVRSANVESLSGTVEVASDLGLPSLGGFGGSLASGSGSALEALLSGTHSAQVSIDGPDRVRVATAKPLAETNWVRNGSDLWSYDSDTLTATHAVIPGSGGTEGDPTEPARAVAGALDAVTPAGEANRLLDAITPTTEVTVGVARFVAGHPSYELVIVPKLAASTVKDAVIAIDASTGLPLEVRIDAVGGSTPAFRIGFSSLSLAVPDASTFAFTAPPEARVVEAASVADLLNPTAPRHRGRPRAASSDGSRPANAPGRPSGATPAAAPNGANTESQQFSTMGRDWSTVLIVSTGSNVSQLNGLFSAAPSVSVGQHQGRLLSTPLLSAVLLDDGRVAVAALTPDALTAELSAS